MAGCTSALLNFVVLLTVCIHYFQINTATAWIDGNCIYGLGEVWANTLRDHGRGGLVTSNTTGFPALNGIRLPMLNFPSPATLQRTEQEQLWSELKTLKYILLKCTDNLLIPCRAYPEITP